LSYVVAMPGQPYYMYMCLGESNQVTDISLFINLINFGARILS